MVCFMKVSGRYEFLVYITGKAYFQFSLLLNFNGDLLCLNFALYSLNLIHIVLEFLIYCIHCCNLFFPECYFTVFAPNVTSTRKTFSVVTAQSLTGSVFHRVRSNLSIMLLLEANFKWIKGYCAFTFLDNGLNTELNRLHCISCFKLQWRKKFKFGCVRLIGHKPDVNMC